MTASSIASRVRQNTVSAAIAAICLIVFGFFDFFSIPKVTDLFTLGDAAFNYTLRIGGVLMAVIAVWSFLGRVTALLADAMVSAAIGCLLIFSGVAMIVGGGGVSLNYGLYVLFGAMFISAGLRNWRDFSLLKATQTPARDDQVGFGSPPTAFVEDAHRGPPSSSLAGRLRERKVDRHGAKPAPLSEAPASTPPPSRPTSSIAERPGESATLEDEQNAGVAPPVFDDEPILGADKTSGTDSTKDDKDDQPPPDGFLASFADDGPPP